VLTQTPGKLTNDFFVNLLDMGTQWKPLEDGNYEGVDRKSGAKKWTGTPRGPGLRLQLHLRAWPRSMPRRATSRSSPDFVAAWAKVMELDRFDLKK
jgi:catalase-peroxidase